MKSHSLTFVGVLRQWIVEIEQMEKCCHVQVHSHCKQELDPRSVIEEYLQVHFPIRDYYAQWSSADVKQFARKATLLPGVRMLKQDPFENVISFICSQNNNISRIGQLVSKVCKNYGTFIGNIHGEDYYSFPTLSDLLKVGNLESELRALSFGYRAAYIAKAVTFLSKQEPDGTGWLLGLRQVPYEEAKRSLLQIPGIGPKVADCVCLMSLEKHNAVPVDTHVLQIALRDYSIPGLKSKSSLTNNTYNQITTFFQNLFGEHAGWAHTVLFCADLRVVPGMETHKSYGSENENDDISDTDKEMQSNNKRKKVEMKEEFSTEAKAPKFCNDTDVPTKVRLK